MQKTYTGSCHCGAVRFEADINIAAGTGKCNCSYCIKLRLWSVKVRPNAFRSHTDTAALTDYRGQNPVAHHTFCANCGIHPYEWVDVPNMAGHSYFNINVACLDGIDIDELMSAPITYFDGRENRWERAPIETRHL